MTKAVTQTPKPGFRDSKGRWDADRPAGLASSSRQDPAPHGKGEDIHMWLFVDLTCMQRHTFTGECACARVRHTPSHRCSPNLPDVSADSWVEVEKWRVVFR